MTTHIRNLDDGCIEVKLTIDGIEGRMVVSSMHLVPDAEAKLKRACTRQAEAAFMQ